jgi:hypothetical protein
MIDWSVAGSPHTCTAQAATSSCAALCRGWSVSAAALYVELSSRLERDHFRCLAVWVVRRWSGLINASAVWWGCCTFVCLLQLSSEPQGVSPRAALQHCVSPADANLALPKVHRVCAQVLRQLRVSAAAANNQCYWDMSQEAFVLKSSLYDGPHLLMVWHWTDITNVTKTHREPGCDGPTKQLHILPASVGILCDCHGREAGVQSRFATLLRVLAWQRHQYCYCCSATAALNELVCENRARERYTV